jgi:peptide/nickel transport system permease protein
MQSSLLKFTLGRILLSVPLLVAVIVITFALIHTAPGDPAILLAGDAPTPEFLEQIRTEYNLDKSTWEQLRIYIVRAFQFDFGNSIYFKRPVIDVILERLPATLILSGAAITIATLVGVTLGVWAAQYRGTSVDGLIGGASLVGYSIPTFWLGQLLVLLLAVHWPILPSNGMTEVRVRHTGFAHVLDVLRHLVLPAATLALFELALIARFTRTAMIDALERDYVVVAFAKGATRRRVVWRHAFPNAIIISITIVGLEFGALLAGAVVTETVFSWPGIGRLFYDAVFRRDFPLLSGLFIFASLAVILVNLVTDILCSLLDPRIAR